VDDLRTDGVESLVRDVKHCTYGAKETRSPVWFTIKLRQTQAREDRFGFRLEGS
jgi:hypothetical protein